MDNTLTFLPKDLNEYKNLAYGSPWYRFRKRPVRYVIAQYIKRIHYPIFGKGIKIKTRTYYNQNMHVHLPAGMDIFLTGGKSHPSEVRLSFFLFNHLKSGQCFADIGAHFGFYSLLASNIVGNHGQVISFEAASKTFYYLNNNIQKYKNIQAHQAIVSNIDGENILYCYPWLYSESNTTIPKTIPVSGSNVEVVRSLKSDTFFLQNQTIPDFIKMDIEGGEENVLKGMVNLLCENPSIVIIMEMHFPLMPESAYYNAALYLQQSGYHSFLADDGGSLLPFDPLRDPHPDQFTSDNLIFKKTED
ncbi:MAG TPA: FkbM family methyltransferase [Saprospiraceae bacterium]|nr:FkbM family methyltransferase [Saprospiraceae bacterium]